MKRFTLFFILIMSLIFLYARYLEPNMFTIHTYQITADVPESFSDLTIVHFSDTLINSEYSTEDLNNLVEKINQLNPDIIFFTGDLIDGSYNASDEEIENITQSLYNLEVSLYKFAVYGDNDLENELTYTTIMDESGFTLLNNENFLFYYKDFTPVVISGITNLTALSDVYKEEYSDYLNITLVHKPDYFTDLIDADIVFAGHSLGGYVNIPFIGSVINKTGSTTYTGSYTYENERALYVSNGLGLEDHYFRFNNIPSINVYTFE